MKKTLLTICLTLGALPAFSVESRRPNVLFAIADDWSFGHAGAYGCNWIKTSAFDRIAKEGILFSNAYTPSAKCAPSRASIITGRNPWQLKAAANHWCHFPSEFRSFPEALHENGYFTGMTGKGWAPGVAEDANGRLREMVGKPFQARTLSAPTPFISKNDYAANFRDFLDAAPGERPWFFWYGGMEPHRPYEYGSGLIIGGRNTADIDRVPGFWPDNMTVRMDMLDYGFEVEHFDRHLGLMLEELEKRGLLDNTLVIVTSDNGMPFPRDKGYAYYESNHLPLAIMWKKEISKVGRRVDDYVSFIDLAPTILELAGVPWSRSGMAPITGLSIRNILEAATSGRIVAARDHVLIGKERNDVGRPNDQGYPIRGILKNGMLYLHNFESNRWPGGNPETGYLDTDGSPTKTEVLKTRFIPDARSFWELCFGKLPADQLFNLTKDPDCITNLAGELPIRELEEQLFAELKAQQDPRIVGGPAFDNFPDASGGRGFYERWLKGQNVSHDWIFDSDFQPAPTAANGRE